MELVVASHVIASSTWTLSAWDIAPLNDDDNDDDNDDVNDDDNDDVNDDDNDDNDDDNMARSTHETI